MKILGIKNPDDLLRGPVSAEIPVIAMSYGYTTIPVSELGADAVLDDFAELPDAIGRLIG